MKISQDTFADAVTGHFIPVDAEPALANAGVGARALGTIVGQDGVLDRAEAEALHTRLARSAKGEVAAAQVLDQIEKVKKVDQDLHPAWVAPSAPRTPSAEARATFRADAARLQQGLNELRERAVPLDHPTVPTVLKGADVALKSAEMLELAFPEAVHFVGVGAGSTAVLSAAAPLVGMAAALVKIGQANHEGKVEGDRLLAMGAYADGIGAGLDPANAADVPLNPQRRALYEQGLFEANALTPEEKRDLEDRLVLIARTVGNNQSYSAPTYSSALARLVGMGHWDPAQR